MFASKIKSIVWSTTVVKTISRLETGPKRHWTSLPDQLLKVNINLLLETHFRNYESYYWFLRFSSSPAYEVYSLQILCSPNDWLAEAEQ